jgi:integrase
MFKFGKARGLTTINPFEDTFKPGEEHSRDRTLNDDEIHDLWHGLDKINCADDLKIAIKLLLATGQRKGEVTQAEWAEFDLEKRLWTLPASRTKNKKAHVVPLSSVAMDLLGQLQAINGNGRWLFPIRRRDQDAPVSLRALTHIAYAHHDKMGLAHFTIHDLRRTVRTNLAALGVDHITAKKVLNHALEGMDAIYNRHDYLKQKTAALQLWADRLNAIVTGEPATVVPIKAA